MYNYITLCNYIIYILHYKKINKQIIQQTKK